MLANSRQYLTYMARDPLLGDDNALNVTAAPVRTSLPASMPDAQSARNGLAESIEARSGATPAGVGRIGGVNVTTSLTPRAQMGLLRLATLMYSLLGTQLKNQASDE
mmetsp:Transcript_24404/g.48867  ORF Transcript_24404/g.48867 Transcript_24404/m.48867 type:complete len:107 (+) Transcript_24404:3094-3414(+)